VGSRRRIRGWCHVGGGSRRGEIAGQQERGRRPRERRGGASLQASSRSRRCRASSCGCSAVPRTAEPRSRFAASFGRRSARTPPTTKPRRARHRRTAFFCWPAPLASPTTPKCSARLASPCPLPAATAAHGRGRGSRGLEPRPRTPTPPGRGPLASPKGDHPTRADPSADPSYRPRKQAGRTPRPCERSALEARGGSQAFSSSATTTSPSYLASPPLLSPAELASSRPLSFACPPPASNPSDTSQQPPGPPSPYRLTMPGLKKTTINASYLCVLPFDERTTPFTEAFCCDCCCVCPDD
jgi:hypothetical protein